MHVADSGHSEQSGWSVLLTSVGLPTLYFLLLISSVEKLG